jgi:4-carboxymuconolactone decarboxylase
MKKAFNFTVLLLVAVTTHLRAQDQSIFPLGEKAKNINHTGDVWLREINQADNNVNSQISVAVFAANSKLNWHSHSGGQVLLITDGIGYYQEKGKPVQVVHKGDVVKCLPDVKHWHGSSPKVGVTYLAVSPKSKTTWLHPVTDAEYKNVVAPTESSTNVEKELVDLSKQKWSWMADKNTDELNDLFHEKSVFVHMGGSWGKQQEINVIRGGGIWYKKADIHDVKVNVIGNTAVLLNRITLLAVVGGKEVTNPFMVTEVYIKDDKNWKLASMSFTKLLTP